MSQLPEHVDKAAVWATVHWWKSPRPLIPHLKRKFDLNDSEALEALRFASNAILGGRQQ